MSQHPLVLRIIPSVWDVPYCSFNLNIDHFAKKEFLVDLPIGELQLERHRGCLIELHFIQQLPAESRFLGSDFRFHLFFFAIFSPVFFSRKTPSENIGLFRQTASVGWGWIMPSGQTVQVMQKLAMNALGDTVVAHDDVLFCGGDSAEAAYFVQSGRLKHGGIFLKTHSW